MEVPARRKKFITRIKVNLKDMNKHLLKYIAFFVFTILLNSCNDSESDLLKSKVYFEDREHIIEVGDQSSLTYDLQSRVSALASSVEVSYEIADPSLVSEYNQKYGANYKVFKSSSAKLSKEVVTIAEGDVYSEKSVLQLSGLEEVEEGKPCLLPIRIKSASLPVMKGTDILYLVINKPVRIMKVAKFSSNYIKVPIIPGNPVSSLTYEALIYIDGFGDNNTIMGCEGVLILRIGDLALPNHAHDLIQIAGNKQFYSNQQFVKNRWYHVAFSYDQPSGKAILYIDGEKAAESTWDTPSFDLASDGGGFFIGKVAGFKWGERPFNGKMSEVRLWHTSRTQNQIKQNMLDVDPASDNLAFYYKLNGDDLYKADNGDWLIRDASSNGMDATTGRSLTSTSALPFVTLDTPVAIK